MSDLQDALDRKYFWRAEQDIMEVPTYSFDLLVDAARKVANAEREWICYYPEFNDEGCLVDHDANKTRQPRKHAACAWFLVIPLGIDSEDDDG